MLIDKEGKIIRLIELLPEYPRYKGSKFQFFNKIARSPLVKKYQAAFSPNNNLWLSYYAI
ncbi:hypothetical protein [Anaerocolumna jejuensis]|uniref:hypothetical protein n=1 Tax=Anaerocolumna jejuensis TaxID=259063 RepID=UPI003F7C5728